ncbi:TIGR04219 family outer membrane beta-barrel protein [Catenovulum sp. 2E275]|uniref:TIGR04219 family outer membrane beta-barrel protein n=1 Tax=Catenovulum sp. 2E275 TaxID=2980497 RepID=UPI0021CED7A5|nr:TIGR04219 family outer membrane beta-barrel protein [Catenovulum sp. 2E275]MCU4676588.1 TIGR04219 family outer membrane beta-barrel protein [Catenovulum sp. 2E275]
MKKLSSLKYAIAAACLVAGNAQADTILGLYAGAQYWQVEPDGKFGNAEDNQATFNFDDEAQGSFYIAFEHPVPLIPNIKLRQTELKVGGSGNVNFEFDGTQYSGNAQVDADLSNTDLILYYEILDNGLASIDFGVTVKNIDGEIVVSDENDSSTEEISGYVPMGYLAAKVGLPLTGLAIYGDVSVLSIGDHSLTDYQAGLAYTFVDNLAVDMSAQIGYRSFKLELDDLDGIYSDLEFSGIYGGLEIHF